jgi:hypothetical protein
LKKVFRMKDERLAKLDMYLAVKAGTSRRCSQSSGCGTAQRELPLVKPTGTPPAGEPYGISTATTDALNTKFTAYENVIGAPASARSTRKAKTADLRPRFRAVDVLLEGMGNLIVQFATNAAGSVNAGGKLFVDGYFNARRIGGSSGGGEEGGGSEGGTTPPPVNPPTPNP